MVRRILFVINSLEMGGTQRHLVQIAAALDRRKWQPEVYCLVQKGLLANDLEAKGILVRGPWITRTASTPSLLVRGFRLGIVACGLMVELVTRRPAIVHFFLPENYVVGSVCALVAGCRNLMMSRRSLNLYQSRRPILRSIERYLHRHMTCILGNSRAVLDELRAEGVPKEKLRLIYNGIDLAPFAALPTKSDARRNLSLPVDAWTMILIANIIPYKGHADLLEALSRIKTRLPNPWRLLCVGRDDGPGVALHTQARRFGIDENIVWLGLRTDVAKLLAAADLGLLVSHEEGFANAVLEGMAAALPMVVTDVGGNAEAVLDGKTGLVVPARDPERLGAAILAFAADPARAAAMGKAGRDRVEWNFSLAACVRQYEALYAELLPETDVLA